MSLRQIERFQSIFGIYSFSNHENVARMPMFSEIKEVKEDVSETRTGTKKSGGNKKSIDEIHSLSSQEELYIENLVSWETTAELASTMKLVFEQENFDISNKLVYYIRSREIEIEKNCKINFHGFMRSFADLVSVREGVNEFKQSVVELSEELQSVGKSYVEGLSLLTEARVVYRNVGVVLEELKVCLNVVGMMREVKAYVDCKRYYPAMRCLNDVEAFHLKNVIYYNFGYYLSRKIPVMKEEIKRRVILNFGDWLFNLKNKAHEIGRLSREQAVDAIEKKNKKKTKFDQICMKIAGEDDVYNSLSSIADKSNSAVKSSIQSTVENSNMYVFDVVNVDFSPFYECLHVYKALGEEALLSEYCVHNRQHQIDVILQSRTSSFWSDYETYFDAIIGCFVTEFIIFKKSSGLIKISDVNSVWSVVTNRIYSFLQVQIVQCDSETEICKLKKCLVRLALTLSQCEYDIKNVIEIIKNILYKRFLVLYTKKTLAKLNSFTACQTYIDSMRQEEAAQNGDTPKIGPLATQILILMEEFIGRFYDFSHDIGDLVWAVNRLLHKICIKFKNIQVNHEDGATHISHILNDFHSLYKHSSVLQDAINKISLENNKSFEYFGESESVCKFDFKQLATTVDVLKIQLHKIIQNFVSENIQLLQQPSHGSALRHEASLHISKIAQFTRNFSKIKILPPHIHDDVYTQTLKFISQQMLNLLLDEKTKQFDMNFAKNLSTDLKHFKDCVQQQDLLHRQYFSQLEQILLLITSKDVKTFLNPETRLSQYPDIQDSVLLCVLNKYREASFFGNFGVGSSGSKTFKPIIEKLALSNL